MYERQVVPPEHVIATDNSLAEIAAAGEVDDRSYAVDHPIDGAMHDIHDRIGGHPEWAAGPGEAAHGWDRPAEALELDRMGLASFAHTPEIKDHYRGDALAGQDDAQGLRIWLISGALIAAFSLGWAGGANSDRFLIAVGASSGPQSPRMVGAENQTVLAKSDKFANAPSSRAGPEPRKPPAPPASMPEYSHKMPSGASKPTIPSASLAALVAQVSATPPDPATPIETKTRLTPIPETRPPSIAGWTVRSVDGKTAVLEGPGGVWKAAAGDSVPGVGRVQSIVRWGNYWVVATSKGLISTR